MKSIIRKKGGRGGRVVDKALCGRGRVFPFKFLVDLLLEFVCFVEYLGVLLDQKPSFFEFGVQEPSFFWF